MGNPSNTEARITIPEVRENFLKALANTGSITKSALLAGVDRSSVYDYRKAHPEFAEEIAEAIKTGEDAWEDEAKRRAVEGVEHGVWKDGRQVGARVEYSDLLMIFLLKGAKPEKYKDRVDNYNYNKDLDLADRLKEARARVAEKEKK